MQRNTMHGAWLAIPIFLSAGRVTICYASYCANFVFIAVDLIKTELIFMVVNNTPKYFNVAVPPLMNPPPAEGCDIFFLKRVFLFDPVSGPLGVP